MEKCKNHPLRFAIARCKRCHLPLCNDCKVLVDDGVFCSQVCVEQFQNFQQRVSTLPATQTRFSFFGCLKTLVISAVLLAVIAGALVFWLGTSDPGEMWQALLKQIRLMF